MIVGIDNITPGTSTSASLSLGSMRAYMQDLLLGIPAIFPDWQFKFFTPEWNEPFEIHDKNVEVVVCRGASKFRAKRIFFEQAVLPRLIAAEKVDVWLGTCNYLPLLARCKTLLLVQSHQFFTNPEAFGWLRRTWLKWIVSMSVRRADRIGVQCFNAKRTLLRYIPVPEESISVIYNRPADLTESGGINPRDDLSALTGIMGRARPYIVYVSALYPFKNHARLIEAFAMIRRHFPDLALVLAGGDAEGASAQDLRHIASKNGVGDDVIFAGRVPQAGIAILYRNARASAFPSLEETFGLPVLEAMSLGCPVLTSNASSMAELAGDAAVLVDPRNTRAIARGLRQLLDDGILREHLIRKGHERCLLFTREKTIASLASALRRVAAHTPRTLANRPFPALLTSPGLQ